jgi:hypothetical protein
VQAAYDAVASDTTDMEDMALVAPWQHVSAAAAADAIS